MFFPKKDTPVYDDPLHVEHNALFFGNTVVFLRNISRIWVGRIEKEKTPWLLLIVLIAFTAFIVSQGLSKNAAVAIIPAIGVLGIVYNIFKKQPYTLNIELNSNTILRFLSHDRDFLVSVCKYLTDIFINGSAKQPIEINFQQKVVYNLTNTTKIKGSTLTNSTITPNIGTDTQGKE